MHGGPGADLYTLMSFKSLADQFTLVFYDHRCNGRSVGAEVTTMTMDNLTADAEALRQALGFEKWAVLGHSFGGNVALEYALRYPRAFLSCYCLIRGAISVGLRRMRPKSWNSVGFPGNRGLCSAVS